MGEEKQEAVIVYNPAAGRRRGRRMAELEQARQILWRNGIRAELRGTQGTGTATGITRDEIARGKELVIVCGGDGTINEVVNGLAGTHIPMAVLPAGTANVLAKELGVPWDIPQAAELIPSGQLRRVALGKVTQTRTRQSRYFLSLAGAGPDGVLVYSVNPGLKERTGQFAYWMEGLQQMATYGFPLFSVTVGGKHAAASAVIVGRTKHYGGPFRITTEADLFGEEFEVVVVTSRSRLAYLKLLPLAWLEKLRGREKVRFWKGAQVSCEAINDPRVYAQVDGESFGRLPVEFEIVSDALTLVVPKAPAQTTIG